MLPGLAVLPPAPPEPAAVLPVAAPATPGGFAALLQRKPEELDGDEAPAPIPALPGPPDSPWHPPRLPAPESAGLAVEPLPVPESLPELTRTLPTPAPRPAEQADPPAPTGDAAVLELLDAALPEGAPPEAAEPPVVEVVAEPARPSLEGRASPPPLPEPLDVVRPAPPDDTLLRFQRLTHDQLTLRVEDAEGAMDVEISREQAALQVRIVAPVEAIPDLMGLGSAIEGALVALGLELGSYTTASREDEPAEPEADEPGEADGAGEPEADPRVSDPDRLLDMVV